MGEGVDHVCFLIVCILFSFACVSRREVAAASSNNPTLDSIESSVLEIQLLTFQAT